MLLAPLIATGQMGTPHSSLSAECSVRQAAPSVPFRVAVRIQLEPQWHTYWLNPGDSGSATEVKWRLPKGWVVSRPQFSVPERIETGGILSYGYEGVAEMVFTVTPPAKAKSATLVGEAQWLVCQEACVPASEKFTLGVKLGPVAVPRTEFRMPQLPTKKVKATASVTKAKYHLRFGLNDAGTDAYFYVESPGTIDHAAVQTFSSVKGGLEVDLAASPYATGVAKRLRGVLVLKEGNRAFLVDTPVSP